MKSKPFDFLRFAHLAIGERFCFLYNVFTVPKLGELTYTKVSKNGWYLDAQGRKWRTSPQVTVMRVVNVESKG